MTPTADPLGAAALWLNQLMAGQLVAILLTLAIASIGLMALYGRVSVRRAGAVVLGCFLVVGAGRIAEALMNAGGQEVGRGSAVDRPDFVPPAPAPAPTPYDPYAGASVPNRNQN